MYSRFTDWLRGFVFWYIQEIDALQRKKPFFPARKIFSRKTIVGKPTTEELESQGIFF